MHTSLSKKLLAGLLSLVMVLSLVAPSMGTQAASKYSLTDKKSVKSGVTYKYQLKGVSKKQYVKVTRNVSGETVKYNKKAVSKTTKINGTGKTLNLYVTYGEKAENYTGKFTVKVYSKKTNKVAKTLVEKVTVKVPGKEAVTSVAIDNTTPKVGDTITAKLTPSNATNVVSYAWFALASADAATSDATPVGTESSLKVTSAMQEKFIKVVVTDSEGATFEAVSSSPVSVDASADVSIIDEMGLQADGTAIVGDTLRISYGVTFGTPTAVSWYRDGSVINTQGSGNSAIGFTLPITATLGTGTYKATVIANGKSYVTNEIVVTNKEEAAKITAYTVEDDYTDGTDVTYGTDDNGAVITVTLAKNYNGTFRVYKSNDSKYRTPITSFTTNVDRARFTVADATATVAPAGWDAIPANSSLLTTDAATNYNVLNLRDGANRALGHINADGTVTYKFHAANGTLTRGEKYVITFDQTSILTDTPSTGTANVYGEAAEIPYVKAPAKLAVTKVANNNNPEVTFYDENGEVLKWFGKTGNGATLGTAGIASAQIYKSTTKTNDPKASGVGILAAGVTNRNGDTLDSGAWSASAPADGTAYWFAQVTTTKGIFGKEAATLTSEAVQIANDAATRIDLIEKGTSSVDEAKTAKVEFANLRTNGTVYIVRGYYQETTTSTNGTTWDVDRASTAANIYAAYTEGISEAIVGQATVEAGAASVEIAQAISEWRAVPAAATTSGVAQTEWSNNYIAVFIPENQTDYGMIYTDDGLANIATSKNDNALAAATLTDSQGLTVAQVATSLAFNKASTTGQIETIAGKILKVNDMTAANFVAKDQFGNTMATAKAAQGVKSVEVVNKNITNDEKASATYEIAANGAVTLKVVVGNIGKDTAKVDKGDGFKITVLGSVIELTNKVTDPVDVATEVGAAHDTATWVVTVDSKTLCAPVAP